MIEEVVTWRQVAANLYEALRHEEVPHLAVQAMEQYKELAKEDSDSNLVAHARNELELTGWFSDEEEPFVKAWGETLLSMVSEFSHAGHSGGSAGAAIMMVHDLLQFKPLGPITSKPEEWQNVAEYFDGRAVWQCRRQCSLFSYDAGKTWYDIDDPRWRKRWSVRAWFWRRKWNIVRARAHHAPITA